MSIENSRKKDDEKVVFLDASKSLLADGGLGTAKVTLPKAQLQEDPRWKRVYELLKAGLSARITLTVIKNGDGERYVELRLANEEEEV